MFEALISLRGNSGRGGGHKIYNNTMVGKNPGISAGIVMGDGTSNAVPNCDVRNNILTGMQFGMLISSGSETGLICDYNDINSVSSVAYYLTGFKSLAQFQALGYMTHGFQSNPQLAASPLILQSGSPCIGAGANLSVTFTTDIVGATRTVPWDMGAYKYGGVSPTQPAAPTNLRLIP
jgi:hypothetical protein